MNLRNACDAILDELGLGAEVQEEERTVLRGKACEQAGELSARAGHRLPSSALRIVQTRCFVELLAQQRSAEIRVAIGGALSTELRERIALDIAPNADPSRPSRGLDPARWTFPALADLHQSHLALAATVKWMRAQEAGMRSIVAALVPEPCVGRHHTPTSN